MMKKMITIALVLAFSGFYAKAAHAAVSVRVPVLCRAKEEDDVYIAKLEALDDTLLETIREGLLYLKNTESGDFVMEFTEPGNYHYRVLQDKDSSSGENFDDTAFAVDVYVSRNDDGTLVAEPIVYEMNGNQKKTAIRFLNMPKEYYEKETESETNELETNEPGTEEPETEEPGTEELETVSPETEPGTERTPETGGDRPGNTPASGQGGGSGTGNVSVRTMDQTPVMLFGILLILSGAAAAVLIRSMAGRRKKGA